MTEPDVPPFVDAYFTFGVQYADEPHPHLSAAHPDGWLRVRGHDFGEAWASGHRLTGGAYSTSYPVERFHPERFPRGELMFCDLTSGERPPEPMPEGLVERMQEAVRAEVARVALIEYNAPYPRRPFYSWATGRWCLAGFGGYQCTLVPGHEGPHCAGGPKAPDGLCEVFVEWSDES